MHLSLPETLVVVSRSTAHSYSWLSLECGPKSQALFVHGWCVFTGERVYRVLLPSTAAPHSFASLSADGSLLSIFEVNSRVSTVRLRDMRWTFFSLYSAEEFVPDYQRLLADKTESITVAVTRYSFLSKYILRRALCSPAQVGARARCVCSQRNSLHWDDNRSRNCLEW